MAVARAGGDGSGSWLALVAFAAGIAACHRLTVLPHPAWPAALVAVGAVLAYVRPGRPTVLLAAAAAGFALQAFHAYAPLAERFPAALERRTVQLEGRITGPVERMGRRARFRFRAQRLRPPDGTWRDYGGTLRLSWYGEPAERLAYGQGWRLAARIRRPRAFRNPGGFDYARFLTARGLGGHGYVRDSPPPQHLESHEAHPRATLEALRREVGAAITAATGDGGPLVRALAIGKRDRLDPATEETLRATGTVHLAVVSGLHVGWVAALAFFVVRALWVRLPSLAERWPAQRAAAGGALLVAAGYAALAGFSLPTQRALIMAAAGLGAWLVGRSVAPGRALLVAAWAVLIWRPDNLHEPGFWLSFGAVAAIALAVRGGGGTGGRLRQAAVVQLAVTVATAPLLLFWFGRVAPLSPLANAFALPVFGFLAVPGALAGTGAHLLGLALPAHWLFAATGVLLEQATAGLAALAAWDPGWRPARPGQVGLVVMLGGVAVALGTAGWRRAWGVVLLLAPLLWTGPPDLVPGRARVWLLDVGQGSAAVVETARHVAVVDCGPRFGPGFDAGSAIIAPFLRSRGWSAVDRLVVSHGDNDHAGGCAGLARAIPVRQRLGPTDPAGLTRWRWDGVRLTTWAASGLAGNDGSRAVRVVAGGNALLLPGDLEAAGERALLAGPLPARAEVLAAPHHGSASSSTSGFVAAVAPEWALVSAGHRNRWGFPEPAVVERYRRAGARLARTDRLGALRVMLGEGVTVRGYRQWADRYWNAGAWRRLSSGGD